MILIWCRSTLRRSVSLLILNLIKVNQTSDQLIDKLCVIMNLSKVEAAHPNATKTQCTKALWNSSRKHLRTCQYTMVQTRCPPFSWRKSSEPSTPKATWGNPCRPMISSTSQSPYRAPRPTSWNKDEWVPERMPGKPRIQWAMAHFRRRAVVSSPQGQIQQWPRTISIINQWVATFKV